MSTSTPDDKLLHTASVLAQFFDNDEDGHPDNLLVVASMRKHKAGIMMFADDREARRLDGDWDGRNLQHLFAEETRPSGAARGEFDATLEELLHSVTQLKGLSRSVRRAARDGDRESHTSS